MLILDILAEAYRPSNLHGFQIFCILFCQLKILSVNNSCSTKKVSYSCKICNYLSIHPNFLVELHHFNSLRNAYYNFNLCLYIIIYSSGLPNFSFDSATEFKHLMLIVLKKNYLCHVGFCVLILTLKNIKQVFVGFIARY